MIPVFKIQIVDMKDRVVSFLGGSQLEIEIVEEFTKEINSRIKFISTQKSRSRAIREGVNATIRRLKRETKKIDIPKPSEFNQ